MRPSAIFVIALIILAIGCGFFPEQVSFSDSRVKELLRAAEAVDRASLGFTQVDRHSKLRLEWRSREKYDAMLHIYGKTQRTIAFRRKGDRFEWIGEQEIFQGPDEYESPDGVFHEEIIVTFEKEPMSGAPLNRVSIRYLGENPDLASRDNLTLSDLKAILQSWGYR